MAENDPPPGKEPTTPDPTQAFQNRLTKLNGDAMAFATQLFDENFRLREDKRLFTDQLTEANKKIPAEGAVVLTGDQVKDYEAYVALGKPADIQARIDAHATLETEIKELKRRDVLREVADIGIDDTKLRLKVLEDRVKASGDIEFVIKETGENGNKRKAAFVKEGDKETPINEYAQANWADYLPSLKVEEAPPATPGMRPDPKAIGAPGNEQADRQAKAQARRAYRY